MKLATCIVTGGPAYAAAHNDARLEIYGEVLRRLSGIADLFAAPAGYFFADSWQRLDALADGLAAGASSTGVAVAVGVDLHRHALPPERRGGAGLTALSVAWDAAGGARMWVQRSSSASNHDRATDEQCREARVLEVAGARVGVLTCGEIFNHRIRSNLVRQQLSAAVDLGHVAAGFRVFSGMKQLTAAGLPACFCSVHSGRWGMKFAYRAGSERFSTRDYDFCVGGAPVVEVKTWEV